MTDEGIRRERAARNRAFAAGEPMTPLAEAAVQLREMFLAYVDAGFTEDQALDLLKTLITKQAPA